MYLSGAVGSRRAKGLAIAIVGLMDVVERAKLEHNRKQPRLQSMKCKTYQIEIQISAGFGIVSWSEVLDEMC